MLSLQKYHKLVLQGLLRSLDFGFTTASFSFQNYIAANRIDFWASIELIKFCS